MSRHADNCQSVRELFNDLPEGSLKVLQITDTHLYADTEGTLLGMNTQQTLDEVLELTNECGNVDLILATGDIVHDGSETAYKRFQSIMETANIPVYCLPGNHDIPDKMRSTLIDSNVQYVPLTNHDGWLFVFLDTTIAESEGGRLTQTELDLLEQSLTEHADKHAMVCLHHHPVPMNSQWMDTMLIENPDEFFAIIDKHENVRSVLWGHVHQEYEQDRNGIKLLASPSTCIQFTPEKDDFGVDSEPPGCRWLALLPDGTVRSIVTRLNAVPEGLELGSEGY